MRNLAHWLRFVLWELMFVVGAALAHIALIPDLHRYRVTMELTIGGTWLVLTLLNVGELLTRLRFENEERDAEIAYGRNYEPNGGKR